MMSENGELLADAVAQFQSQYAEANRLAVETEGEGWDRVWNVVVRRAAEDLQQPDADVFLVRRRLERVADLYRRAICDPVRLFASLRVQQAVVSGCTNLEQWCDENIPVNPSDQTHDPISAGWHTVLSYPNVFSGWPVEACDAQHESTFQWRPTCNLYCNPHAGCDPLDVEFGDDQSRMLLLTRSVHPHADLHSYAAVGETFRMLEDAPLNAIGATVEEWSAYRQEIQEKYGNSVDLEQVAITHCAYPDRSACPNLSTAEWRAPIRDTEAAAVRLLQRASPESRAVVQQWLGERCGYGPAFLGLRYPPAFTALLADLFAERWLPLHDRSQEPPVPYADNTRCEPHPWQVYSVWLRYGFVRIPDAMELTRGWDTLDHLALERSGGRCTRAFLNRWRVDHSEDVSCVD